MNEQKTLDAASRIVHAGPAAYRSALLCGTLAWRPPYTFLPDASDPPTGDDTDLAWASVHARTLGLDPTHPLAASCARVARTHPHAWAHAMLQTRPIDFHADAHPPLADHPLAAWDSRYADPHLIDGATGPAVACALANLSMDGAWRTPALRPDGRAQRVDDRVWRLLDPAWFAGDPDW